MKRLKGDKRFFGVSVSRTFNESELDFFGLLIGDVVITKELNKGSIEAVAASEVEAASEVTVESLKIVSTSLSAKSSSFLFSFTVKPISMVFDLYFLAEGSNFRGIEAELGAELRLSDSKDSRLRDKSARVRTLA